VAKTLSIIRYPHPTLRYRSKTIQRVDAELKSLVGEMFELMYEHNGVGLAANQVDLPLRIFVANPAGKRGEGEEIVCINPEVNLPKGSEADREGCLSLPEIFGEVKRPAKIKFSAYDLTGNLIQRDLEGFLARIVQHEIDHLNGVYFFDRMDEAGRAELEPKLKSLENHFREQQQNGEVPGDEELVARLANWESRYA
jgi:peptide deformylase